MTDAFTQFHPAYQRARSLGVRSRHVPLTPTTDTRQSPWVGLVKIAAVSFMLGVLLYAALIVL